MKSDMLQNESDIQCMRDLIAGLLNAATVVDFEENMLLPSVRAVTRLWLDGGKIAGFAYIDDYNNLQFEIDPAARSTRLEDEIVEWGLTCVKKRNIETGIGNTLDACFDRKNSWQIALLERFGFVRDSVRTLRYTRSLSEPIAAHAFPRGFSLRCVAGEQEVECLVTLHRAAFGTQNMTVERRLAIMRAPQYVRELDFVAAAPDGEWSAFCICGFADENNRVGYTDPIGVHPRYQNLGLGTAIVSAGLQALKDRGANVVELGTSSENIAMQRLACALGFALVSEKLWFSKQVR